MGHPSEFPFIILHPAGQPRGYWSLRCYDPQPQVSNRDEEIEREEKVEDRVGKRKGIPSTH